VFGRKCLGGSVSEREITKAPDGGIKSKWIQMGKERERESERERERW